MLRLLSATVLATVLVGCATGPPPVERLKLVPKEQVVALPAVTSVTPANVRVVRDEGFVGSAVFMHLSLNGKSFASLNPGEYIEFPADPGEYLFSVMLTDPFGLRHPTTLEAVWRANGKYNYRVGMDGNLAVTLFRVPD